MLCVAVFSEANEPQAAYHGSRRMRAGYRTAKKWRGTPAKQTRLLSLRVHTREVASLLRYARGYRVTRAARRPLRLRHVQRCRARSFTKRAYTYIKRSPTSRECGTTYKRGSATLQVKPDGSEPQQCVWRCTNTCAIRESGLIRCRY